MSPVTGTVQRRRLVLSGVVVAIAAAFLVWRYTPASELASADRIAEWLEGVAGHPWSPLLMTAVYVLAGLVMFPLLVMITATGMAFPPLTALGVAFAGSLASASLLYFVGARLLQGWLPHARTPTMLRVRGMLNDPGVLAIALVRMVPVAPYTVVNLAAGALHVPFRDYLIGSALGLTPGILLLTAFGSRLRALWENPTAANIALLAGLILAWIALSVFLQRLTSRSRARQASPGGPPRGER